MFDKLDLAVKVKRIAKNKRKGKWKGYSFRSLNEYGDFNIDMPPTTELLTSVERGIPYLSDAAISKKFLRFHHDVSELASRKSLSVIYVWPPTISNYKFDYSATDSGGVAGEFREGLLAHGVDVKCSPADFSMSAADFFYTKYHLNMRGANQWSLKVAQCLNPFLGL